MVQIRSQQNHEPMPRIEVGDIGQKLGYNSIDNGFLSFNNVRIPRTNLLSRFVEVEKDGSFSLKGDPRVLYQIMV
jgi:acyl-CoA oxidase